MVASADNLVHSISCLRCDALSIDQGRHCVTAVQDYEGRMPSNRFGGTWLHDAFTVGILWQRCNPHSENRSGGFLPHLVHLV
jgi:hypothetical protein